MPKTTLTERMEKKSAPKSWIAEVRSLHLKIKELRGLNESYLDTIDKLARQVEELKGEDGD